MNGIDTIFKTLVSNIATMSEVLSIGRSGGGRSLPVSPAGGDIDVFVYCDTIPSPENRRIVLDKTGAVLDKSSVGVFGGGRWGIGDLTHIGGIETWLMYFTADEAMSEVESILRGEQPDKADNYFYPTGRCAMLAGMEILYDKTGFLASLKVRLAVYPEELATSLTRIHLGKLDNTEDLERAVARKDTLFYHFALDIALDHFLQALFAVNRVFFPSRKRSLEFISGFEKKPMNCGDRLLEVVRLGGLPESLENSFSMWRELTDELQGLDKVI